jgi:hypothetical protein
VAGGLVAADGRRLRAADYLRYSFGTLTGRDWGDVRPVGNAARTLARLALLISFALIALLMITLNN